MNEVSLAEEFPILSLELQAIAQERSLDLLSCLEYIYRNRELYSQTQKTCWKEFLAFAKKMEFLSGIP